MTHLSFVQAHPMNIFDEKDTADYTARDRYFIQCLNAMESIMDIDAYIIDYKNQRILYATKSCLAYFDMGTDKNNSIGVDFLDEIICPEDLPRIATINALIFDFFFKLPTKRRAYCYFTQNFRIKTNHNNTMLINHKETFLDSTENGALRLTLCIISSPTSDKPGNSYIKMTDTNTVYEFIPQSNKFVEVKTQKLTSKATRVLKLASNGKREAQIAKELNISISTVKYHKQKIFAQLGVNNTAEAVQWMNNQKKMIKRR